MHSEIINKNLVLPPQNIAPFATAQSSREILLDAAKPLIADTHTKLIYTRQLRPSTNHPSSRVLSAAATTSQRHPIFLAGPPAGHLDADTSFKSMHGRERRHRHRQPIPLKPHLRKQYANAGVVQTPGCGGHPFDAHGKRKMRYPYFQNAYQSVPTVA